MSTHLLCLEWLPSREWLLWHFSFFFSLSLTELSNEQLTKCCNSYMIRHALQHQFPSFWNAQESHEFPKAFSSADILHTWPKHQWICYGYACLFSYTQALITLASTPGFEKCLSISNSPRKGSPPNWQGKTHYYSLKVCSQSLWAFEMDLSHHTINPSLHLPL